MRGWHVKIIKKISNIGAEYVVFRNNDMNFWITYMSNDIPNVICGGRKRRHVKIIKKKTTDISVQSIIFRVTETIRDTQYLLIIFLITLLVRVGRSDMQKITENGLY